MFNGSLGLVLWLAATLSIPPTPGRIEDGRPVLGCDDSPFEAETYCRYLLGAPCPNSESDKPLSWVSYRNLHEAPDQFRGRLVRIRGSLRAIVEEPTPQWIRERGGPAALYQAWISTDSIDQPVCLILTELTGGLNANRQLNVPVGLCGRFFKWFRYPAPDGWHDAPLLVGGHMIVHDWPTGAAPASMLGAGVPCGVGVLAIGGLAVWLRADDRKNRRRLRAQLYKFPRMCLSRTEANSTIR